MAADGAWDVTADVERYDEATDWFLKRTVLTAADAHALDDRLKADAFWVGGGLHLSQVQRVFDKITTAIERGQNFEDWRKTVKDELKNPAHARLVFQNATQRAYNNGRWEQMHEPSTLRFRPYGMVDAILDGRTTEYCRQCNGTIELLEHPYWLTHWFPAHHFCRTCVRNLRKSEAERRGLKPPVPGLDPPAGWGQSPRVAQQWKPDPTKHDPKLIEQLEFNFAKGGAKKRKPRKPPTPKPVLDTETWTKHYEPKFGEAAKSLGHGRAALELGLDLPLKVIRRELKKLDTSGSRALLEACEDAVPGRTLREQGGELDPMRKAAAALGGHLHTLAKRPKVQNAQLAGLTGGQQGLDFFSAISGPTVKFPGADWVFKTIANGGDTSAGIKQIRFDWRPGTLEHELGHSMEVLNPPLFQRAIAFLRARTKGERLKSHKNGKRTIRAWDDHFSHWYTGCKYQWADGTVYGTEITSTALEVLVANGSVQGTLERLAQKDMEHLLFALGQLAGP